MILHYREAPPSGRRASISKTGYEKGEAVHGHFNLTGAFPVLSVSSPALQDGRSRIENALF